MTNEPLAIERDLAAPLDPRRVQSREGSGGKKLSYLTTHDVKRTANRIFGYDGWSYLVDDLISLGEEPFKNSKGREGIRVGYRATVTVTIGEVRRGDVGYGDAMEYNGSRITPHELAAKEAVSDALKRCLSSWGDQFGLVLYGADPAPPLEEQPEADEKFPPAAPPKGVISADQVTKLWTMARGYKLSEDQIRSILAEFAGVESTKLIPRGKFQAVLNEIELTGKGVSA
jgi:DNA recombination protein Rad52